MTKSVQNPADFPANIEELENAMVKDVLSETVLVYHEDSELDEEVIDPGDHGPKELPSPFHPVDSDDPETLAFVQRFAAASTKLDGYSDAVVNARASFDGETYYFLAVAPEQGCGRWGETTDHEEIERWLKPEAIYRLLGVEAPAK